MPKGNTIQFVYTGTAEGKPFKEVIDMTFTGKDKDQQLALRGETFVGGVSTSWLEVKGRK